MCHIDSVEFWRTRLDAVRSMCTNKISKQRDCSSLVADQIFLSYMLDKFGISFLSLKTESVEQCREDIECIYKTTLSGVLVL